MSRLLLLLSRRVRNWLRGDQRLQLADGALLLLENGDTLQGE